MGQSRLSTLSRRRFLGSVGVTGFGALTGCVTIFPGSSQSVTVLSAGSLAQTFEQHVGPAFEAETGQTIHGEYYGSNAVMRMVEDRTKHPDVVVSADATLLRDSLYGTITDWDVEFAGNSLGLGYTDSTTLGQRLGAGEAWYEVAEDADDGDIAIGDPDLDPLGYRAIQAFELAQREHGLDGFRDRMTQRVYREPEEPQLMAGVETGSRSAAVVYRNMALDHDLSFCEFSDRYDFSNPALADHYATVSYTTDNGYSAAGRPILYNTTVNDDADNPTGGRKLVQFLIDNPAVLTEAGLTVSESLPRTNGAVPTEVSL